MAFMSFAIYDANASVKSGWLFVDQVNELTAKTWKQRAQTLGRPGLGPSLVETHTRS